MRQYLVLATGMLIGIVARYWLILRLIGIVFVTIILCYRHYSLSVPVSLHSNMAED